MPLSFQYTTRPRSKIVCDDDSFRLNGPHMAWWQCGFKKNYSDDTQPTVLMAFRKIDRGTLADKVVYQELSVAALGQVRLGSIWQDRECTSQAVFEARTFDVDFTNGWRFTSFKEASKQGLTAPFPQEIYPLEYKSADMNWLLEFDLPTGGKLIIPCIEFFARCYGSSGELRRILAAYTWEGHAETVKAKCFAPLDTEEIPGVWQVRLQPRLRNRDAVFLAHVKYDPYTELAAKRIHSQIQVAFEKNSSRPIFAQIAPWFKGSTKLIVEGIAFGNSFLALRVNGMEDPSGDDVERSRVGGKAKNPAPESAKTRAPGFRPRMQTPRPIINLAGNRIADRDAGTVEFEDDDFVTINPRPVKDVQAEQAKTKSGGSRPGQETTTSSLGEARGAGKGVGQASIHAPEFPSNGWLRDMWDAMIALQKRKVIDAVDWYTYQHGFSASMPIMLITVPEFKKNDEVETRVKSFPFLDREKTLRRGILVARIQLSDGPVYIVEIARSPIGSASLGEGEQSFQGIVFRLSDEKDLNSWLRELIDLIRRSAGVLSRIGGIEGKCPGVAMTFPHNAGPKQLAKGVTRCEYIVAAAIHDIGSEINLDVA